MKYSFLCVICLLSVLFIDSSQAGEWIQTADGGCLLWHPHPEEAQKVRWEGVCKDGKAHGDGVAEWYSYQRPPDRCECTFTAGKAEGMGTYRWADGVLYVGEFKAGLIEGKGFIRYPDNEMYEGDFKNGHPHGWGVQMLPDNTKRMGRFRDGAFVSPK